MRWARRIARCALWSLGLLLSCALATPPAPVVPGRVLSFPRDHASHPDFRTEWWYVTGWLKGAAGEPLGFQVTFFRSRSEGPAENPSRFAPRQILIAHAAISDPARGRLWTDERIARAGFGLAEASERDAQVWIDRWRLERTGSLWLTRVDAADFAFELALTPTQAPLLHGAAGFSQKGPSALAASYYYSLPQLRASGTLTRAGRREPVAGEAWLDHEWSSEALEAQAAGWDWVGLNLLDGGALMAFRTRDRQGQMRWAGGTLETANGAVRILRPQEIQWTAGRAWRSPRTGVQYPIAWELRAAGRTLLLEPLLDDQENDTRRSSGAIYWEGAVRAREAGRLIGRGYLELTGYGEPLQLR